MDTSEARREQPEITGEQGSAWQWSPADTDRYAGAETGADILGQDVATAPGDLPIKLVVERAQRRRSQFRHDNTIDPLGPGPGHSVRVLATSGEDIPIGRAKLFFTVDGSLPTPSSPSIAMEAVAREWDILAGYLTLWQAEVAAQPASVSVRYRIGGWAAPDSIDNQPEFWAQDGQGFWFRFEPRHGITTFAYAVENPSPPAPPWVRDGVIYQVFLDRFRTSAADDTFLDTGHRGIHGGTLDGVRRSLGYIDELGATCIWLSPLHPAETYHRYDAMDFDEVDPALGTLDDLKRLTDAGAERQLRFLMDFVPSHLSWHHPAFLEAQRDPSAQTASWFTFYHHPDRYRTFLDLAPFLPSINTDDPSARQHLIDSATRWLRDYGVSGFRLDHAIGPSMDFWVAFREATKRARPDCFATGEATDTPDSLRRFRQKLDSILDFPLARALRSTFALETWTLARMDRFLNSYEAFMETGPYRVSFLDNHDMDRFLFVAGHDVNRLKLAALCQFALLPTPTIYYGTEIALHQSAPASNQASGGDAQVRGDMIWDDTQWNQDVLDFYRRLCRVRRSQASLRYGARRTIHLDPSRQTYAFSRVISPGDGQTVIAAFNLSQVPQEIDVSSSHLGRLQCLIATGRGDASASGAGKLRLDPTSGAIYAAGI